MAEHSAAAEETGGPRSDCSAPTRIMLAVNQSSIKGYPNPSISSMNAFHWVVKKIIQPPTRSHFKLLILHVQVPDDDAFDDTDSLFASKEDFQTIKHGDQIRGVHLLQHFVHECNELKIPCRAWVRKGDIREVICKEVARAHPDMLVLGSRGLRTIQKIFVGTVSEYCVKHVDCPVLVVRRKQEDAPEDSIED
ncbi:hypothetical protein KP509_37G052900 [Ceratopteris richardii]|uniref:UspA domain-containing protein n=1 Tax=Ceratopteris richardii TaxID=49495 RepID=A0A8T2Q912_CERRI|nr:hypothetical protein KP509_37G052900 [Ceratopteris richardii]